MGPSLYRIRSKGIFRPCETLQAWRASLMVFVYMYIKFIIIAEERSSVFWLQGGIIRGNYEGRIRCAIFDSGTELR